MLNRLSDKYIHSHYSSLLVICLAEISCITNNDSSLLSTWKNVLVLSLQYGFLHILFLRLVTCGVPQSLQDTLSFFLFSTKVLQTNVHGETLCAVTRCSAIRTTPFYWSPLRIEQVQIIVNILCWKGLEKRENKFLDAL